MPGRASTTACTDRVTPPSRHLAVAERTHLPTAVVAGSPHPEAAAEAESHLGVAADSFREAVDWSLSSFFLSSETQSIYGVSGATWPPLSLR
jgi:hypothetical protein